MTQWKPSKVGVVGLGYVGLPLAVAFSEHVPTVGMDVSESRIAGLRKGTDRNGEIPDTLLRNPRLAFTTSPEDLQSCDFIILGLPTPVMPDGTIELQHLLDATQTVGRVMRPGTTVTVESTVYPGATEELLLPALEESSGLRAGEGFFLGYTPERINPGDPDHTVSNVVKVVAGHTPEALERVAGAYGLIATKGVFRGQSIKAVEAAKIVENMQRDVNIALMNELARVFAAAGIDTRSVLDAASTKWNFVRFEPGLVGGACVPAAPVYLGHLANRMNLTTPLLQAGREVNEGFADFIAERTCAMLTESGHGPGPRILQLGVTFKENVHDARHSRAVHLAKALAAAGAKVTVHDPRADPGVFGFDTVADPTATESAFDAIVLAVPHAEYRNWDVKTYVNMLAQSRGPGVFVDVRGAIPGHELRTAGVRYWRV